LTKSQRFLTFSIVGNFIGREHVYNKSSAVAEMGDRLATMDMGRKVGRAAVGGGAGSPLGHHLTQCGLGRGLLLLPSGILIHPTVWPHL